MRILFLTNHLRGNDGLSKISLDFAESLQKLGHDILCLTHERSEQTGIKEITVLDNLLRYLANPLLACLTAFKIRRIVENFSPDIIHFMESSYAGILPFLRTGRAKTVITIHGTYSVTPILFKSFFKKTLANYLSQRYYKKVDGVIAVSHYTKNHLLKYYPEWEPKVKVITNGVNLEREKIIDLSQKQENKTKKILFVGQIKGRKGVLEAIEACRHYRDNFSDNFNYDIVGAYNKDHHYYRNLLSKVKEYRLEDKVFFRGRVSDEELKNYYLAADLFLMPSLNINNNFEGFGLVFLEANTKGVPCIGSRDSGCREAILDGRTGYLIDPRNPGEIAEKMDLILNQNAINGQECINWAKQNDIKNKVEELLNFYHDSPFSQRER